MSFGGEGAQFAAAVSDARRRATLFFLSFFSRPLLPPSASSSLSLSLSLSRTQSQTKRQQGGGGSTPGGGRGGRRGGEEGVAAASPSSVAGGGGVLLSSPTSARRRRAAAGVNDDGDDDNDAGPSSPGQQRNRPHRGPPASWTRGELIGAGAFGRVYLGLDDETGELFAVKTVSLPSTVSFTSAAARASSIKGGKGKGGKGDGDDNSSDEDFDDDDFADLAATSNARRRADDRRLAPHVEALRSEVELLAGLDHPNIVRYLGTEQRAALPEGCSTSGAVKKKGKRVAGRKKRATTMTMTTTTGTPAVAAAAVATPPLPPRNPRRRRRAARAAARTRPRIKTWARSSTSSSSTFQAGRSRASSPGLAPLPREFLLRTPGRF